jgi:hypothetical protein
VFSRLFLPALRIPLLFYLRINIEEPLRPVHPTSLFRLSQYLEEFSRCVSPTVNLFIMLGMEFAFDLLLMALINVFLRFIVLHCSRRASLSFSLISLFALKMGTTSRIQAALPWLHPVSWGLPKILFRPEASGQTVQGETLGVERLLRSD